MSTVPPTANVVVVVPELPSQGAAAGIASRTIASVVDAVLVLVAVMVGYLGISAVLFLAHPTRFRFPAPSSAVLIPIALAVAAGYLAVSWRITGRTYGDHVLGLRVVTRNGAKLGLGRASLRAVAYVVVPFGLVWAAVSRNRRSLQDIALGTRVVYDWD